jgi:hypothetical protein
MVTTSALDSLEITRWELGDLEFFFTPPFYCLESLSINYARGYHICMWS